MKVCTKCGEDKPLSEYHKHKRSKDGHQSACKVCDKAASRARYEVLSKAPEHTCETSGCDQLSKVCTGCGEDKPLTDFCKDKSKKDGHRNGCKVCRKAASQHDCVASGCDHLVKTCTKCGEDKPLSEYYKHKRSKDGHRADCKACALARQNAYNEANRDKRIAYNKAYYQENHEKLAVQKKAYREANREERAASDKAYYEANREEILVAAKAYHAEKWANDPEYRERQAAKATRRRRLLAAAKQEFYLREDIFERDGWTCQLCQEPIDPELRHPDSGFASIDHILPLSLGGDDIPANVQAAHLGCNLSKHNRVKLEDQTMLDSVTESGEAAI